MFKCSCGRTSKTTLGHHKKKCPINSQLRETILSDVDNIVSLYLKTYSVQRVMKELEVDGVMVVTRTQVEDVLKKEKVYEGQTGDNYGKRKRERWSQTMLNRYGTTAVNNNLEERNAIPYEPIVIGDDDYEHWAKRVEAVTKKSLKTIEVPETCAYTGFEFADNKGTPNPNDPFKRTIDHKTPKRLAYIYGWTPEQTGAPENLAYVIRYANSLKSNTDYESFKPVALYLREAIKNQQNHLSQ